MQLRRPIVGLKQPSNIGVNKSIPMYVIHDILSSAVDCKWEWEPFGQCSRTCGGGKRSRFPIITQHSQDGGRPCPPNVLNRVPETVECNADPCPGECVIM